MKTNQLTVPVAALAIALGSFSAEAQDRGDRRSRSNDSARQGRNQRNQDDRIQGSADRDDQQRANTSARRRDGQANRDGQSANRNDNQTSGVVENNRRASARDSRDSARSDAYAQPRDSGRARTDDRRQTYGGTYRDSSQYGNNHGSNYSGSYGGTYRDSSQYGNNHDSNYGGSYGGSYGNNYGDYGRNYYAPRLLSRRSTYGRYYGSGGRLSLYFGIGSGHLFGSPYSGRVYGSRRGSSYGSHQSYGDVRLQVSPRDAEVYVDGYYAGIVDDFDGRFQRLALEAGPHEIEIVARGVDSQVFDVYVDPSRTVNLRADLLR